MENRTEAILDLFVDSWIKTEKFYVDLSDQYAHFERLKPILLFIQDLKRKGYDKFFRLGSSVDFYLVISRSVNHGLRNDQKWIKIEAYDKTFDVILRDGTKTYRRYTLDSLNDSRLTNLLNTLKSTLVD
jgi:hypothetical protein